MARITVAAILSLMMFSIAGRLLGSLQIPLSEDDVSRSWGGGVVDQGPPTPNNQCINSAACQCAQTQCANIANTDPQQCQYTGANAYNYCDNTNANRMGKSCVGNYPGTTLYCGYIYTYRSGALACVCNATSNTLISTVACQNAGSVATNFQGQNCNNP